MPIRVYIDYIDKSDCNRIIEYYNSNIPIDQPKLEILDRCEGGFQIPCPSSESDANLNIKQLRWNKKYLLPYSIYKGFSNHEEKMLFMAMKYVLGKKVTYEE